MTTEINFSERGFLAPHGLEDYRNLTRDMMLSMMNRLLC